MEKSARIYVAGHTGLVGSAITRRLRKEGYDNLILRDEKELDLRDQGAVAGFFRENRPEYVMIAAAKVGGIVANNSYPADFIYTNLMIQSNVIHHAYAAGVKRLLFLGSSCIYPKMAPQPIKEEYLLTGPLEPTNDAYAIAKIAGVKMCQSYNRQYGTQYVAAMPTNLYGPNDNFNLETSHVLPALLRKFHEAKLAGEQKVTVWGTGTPFREFIFVDDVAEACLFLMNLEGAAFDALLDDPKAPALVNVGTGVELTIRDLALTIKEIVGFTGDLVFDSTKPDGTPRKLTDVTKIHSLGWRHRMDLREGVAETYRWYLENRSSGSH
ncbi:GDP-L-fucose synthase [Geobacter sp. DSM 9736]|uniref:GDP-L-fucose synthase family protein n=1 Tax=Geobacter sp. DSM 9736 TaxID=1277350 RepID=UPI000B504DFE|nr:GDP-L-fucose synthase [Geobacter sp. DSM 9736]SNB44727.1 GDP-L-fucose synthase [Geobacter sp. DSM 9736]